MILYVSLCLSVFISLILVSVLFGTSLMVSCDHWDFLCHRAEFLPGLKKYVKILSFDRMFLGSFLLI